MRKCFLCLIVIVQFLAGCENEDGFYDTPEEVSGILELMEKDNIGIDLHISVLDLGGDSLKVDYFLVNNTTLIDTLIVSSGSPVNISYRYGRDLNSTKAEWVFPSDANILPLPSGDSLLIESRVIKTKIENDYLLRAIYTFSYPEGSGKGQYWLVSNPILVSRNRN